MIGVPINNQMKTNHVEFHLLSILKYASKKLVVKIVRENATITETKYNRLIIKILQKIYLKVNLELSIQLQKPITIFH